MTHILAVWIPDTFWYDHKDRAPCDPGVSTATAVKCIGRSFLVEGTPASIACLRADAAYYANRDNMDECPRYLVNAARKTLEALDHQITKRTIPPLEHGSNSWIVSDKETGVGILETSNRKLLMRLNQDLYRIETAGAYLRRINAEIKAGSTAYNSKPVEQTR